MTFNFLSSEISILKVNLRFLEHRRALDANPLDILLSYLQHLSQIWQPSQPGMPQRSWGWMLRR